MKTNIRALLSFLNFQTRLWATLICFLLTKLCWFMEGWIVKNVPQGRSKVLPLGESSPPFVRRIEP